MPERTSAIVLDPILRPHKTLQQRNTILNSAGTKEVKAMNTLKQRRDNFQFGGKDKLKLTVLQTQRQCHATTQNSVIVHGI